MLFFTSANPFTIESLGSIFASKRCLMVLALVLPLVFYGQFPEKEVVVELGRGNGSTNYIDYVVLGTAYVNPEPQKGYTLSRGKKTEYTLMRYDGYRDQIEIFQDKTEPTFLIKKKDLEAVINDRKYRFIDFMDHGKVKSGYLTPLNEGETILYSRIIKTIQQHRPETGYESFKPPEFILKSSYYLKRRDSPAMPLNDLSRKEVFAVLWEHYTELRTYARENKLKMRTEQEVIQVLEYYDGLPKK